MTPDLPFWIVLILAICMDWLLGDPVWLPHPIRWMGKTITALEPRFRNLPMVEMAAGALFTGTLVAGTWISVYLSLRVCNWIHPHLATLAEIILIYFSLSIRSLDSTARQVLRALISNQLPQARKWVGHLIGRDLSPLDESAVARGAVESVAENFVDGVVSPLFFAVIGGAPAAMAYKMINTLDSMVGYRNNTYLRFGKAAARLDDVANFIPARIAVMLIATAAQLTLHTGRRALHTAVKEGSHHPSPNAGYSEAAFAGALGIWLNGPNYYHGELVEKPVIGAGLGEIAPDHIRIACDLMLLASMLCLVTFLVFYLIFNYVAIV